MAVAFNLNAEDSLGLGNLGNSLGNWFTPNAQLLANIPRAGASGPVTFNYNNSSGTNENDNSNTTTTIIIVVAAVVLVLLTIGIYYYATTKHISRPQQ